MVVLVGYALLSAYPFLWMVSGSFKNQREVLSSGRIVPKDPTLRTLADTWSKLDFARYLTNSILVTTGTVALILVVYPMAGYAFSVLRFPGRRVLFAGFGAILFVPGVTTLLPLVLLTQKLHLLGSWTGLGLAFANGAGPLAILIFKTFYDSIPTELREAALIDGAGELRIHFGIYLPLARPAVAAVAVLNFVAIWNEYVLSSVSLTDPAKFTLPLGLQNLLSTNVVQWNQVMAGAMLLVLPIIIVFVALQRYFVSAIQGAIKG
ncbi:MAG: carbohydrate ABC transporter permease [Jatrophihabitans sp.]